MPELQADRKLTELEGLRGICASLVVLSHVGEFLPQREGIIGYLAAIPAPFGFLSVIIFFILSGFVIGRATPVRASGRGVADYLLKRLIRIYPIYLIALVVSFLVAGKHIVSGDFLLQSVFLQNAAVETINSNGPLWSLNNEVVYYLAFVIVLLVPKAVYALFAASIAGAVFATFQPEWYFNLLGLFGFWLAGLILSRNAADLQGIVVPGDPTRFWTPMFLLAANMATGAWPAILKQVGVHAGLTFTVAINSVLIFDVFASVLGKAIARPYWVPSYALCAVSTAVGLAYGYAAGNFAVMPSATVALMFFVLAGIAWLFEFASPTPAQWARLSAIGSISYGLYVIHYPILFAAKELFAGSWIAILLAVPTSFAAAAVLEGFLQPRIRRWFLSSDRVKKVGIVAPEAPISEVS
jgi:peptidoglycan/LPS O-acetylase OafA/YrhL